MKNPSANSEQPVLIVSQLGTLKVRKHVTTKVKIGSNTRIIAPGIVFIYIFKLIIYLLVIEVNERGDF
ncbi:hypothetical protein BK788_21705 [Bacillus thuringiensis serovar sinensis]|nr:hypothetical protein BK788_21705 [Bacillus thuringiensis serovar sinensis]